MKISEAFPSKYLAASDLMPSGVPVDATVTISNVTLETLGQGRDAEQKPVVFFQGHQKGCVFNKTNSRKVAESYGDDTDAWLGKSIILTAREVEFQGDNVWAIRVKIPAGQTVAQTVAPFVAPAAAPANSEQAAQDASEAGATAANPVF